MSTPSCCLPVFFQCKIPPQFWWAKLHCQEVHVGKKTGNRGDKFTLKLVQLLHSKRLQCFSVDLSDLDSSHLHIKPASVKTGVREAWALKEQARLRVLGWILVHIWLYVRVTDLLSFHMLYNVKCKLISFCRLTQAIFQLSLKVKVQMRKITSRQWM